MKAVGIGSFWFANRSPLLEIDDFQPAKHLNQVQQALESVDNVSDVTITKPDHARGVLKIFHDDDGTMVPICCWTQIAFRIYLPQRVQQSYARHSVVAGGTEYFYVTISYGSEFPVAYIYYDVSQTTGRENPSDAVIIVREYLATNYQSAMM